MKRLAIMMGLAGCGGAPLLGNVPHPNNAAVAGVAAAAAAAMTIADPNGTTFKRETLTPEQQKEVESHATVPTDVLDRLDNSPAAGAPKSKQAPSQQETDGQPLPAGPDDHPNPLAPAP